MSPEAQKRFVDRARFKFGYENHPEFKVRKLAQEAAHNEWTYLGGSHWPAKGYVIGGPLYHDIHVQLLPELQDQPELATLIAEKIIRRELRKAGWSV